MAIGGSAEYFPVAAVQGRAIHIARKKGWGGRILCGTVTSFGMTPIPGGIPTDATCGNCKARYRAAMRQAAPRPTAPARPRTVTPPGAGQAVPPRARAAKP